MASDGPYSVIQDGIHVFVIDRAGSRLCDIPHVAAPWLTVVRTDRERLDIADTLARLLNEEDQRCHQAARNREHV